MINIDKVIDDYNENELPKKIDEALNYYQVLDNINTPEGVITTTSNEITYAIKENDQHRTIIFDREELLAALAIPSEKVELKVTVLGRDCDNTGHPIDY